MAEADKLMRGNANTGFQTSDQILSKTRLTTGPTQHGEVNAIQKCVRKFNKDGLTRAEIVAAWSQLCLYTVLGIVRSLV
jgi:hypothetical protein